MEREMSFTRERRKERGGRLCPRMYERFVRDPTATVIGTEQIRSRGTQTLVLQLLCPRAYYVGIFQQEDALSRS